MPEIMLACPVCSSCAQPPVCLALPEWRLAPRTTEKRGVRCAFLFGCRHVEALIGKEIIEASNAAAAISRWNSEAKRLFEDYTARWTPAQRESRRARLEWPTENLPAVNLPASPTSVSWLRDLCQDRADLRLPSSVL